MRFEKRIRALEARMTTDPLVLYFADGSTRELRGPRHFLLSLLVGACGGADLSSRQAEQLDLIRQSVSAHEPGGGHMTEVLRCCLNGPAKDERSPASDSRNDET
jgi:hypothetical protein